jgi:O-antigen ligase
VTLTLGVLLLTGYLAAVNVDFTGLARAAKGAPPIIANSVGRGQQGGEDRALLLSENLNIFRHEDLLGLGPGGTKRTLQEEQAAYVKEAHNDYLATLVERGVVGVVGLLMLLVAAGRRAAEVMRARPGPGRPAAVARPVLLAAGGVALALSGWFHEVLHFRHVWAVLGLLAAAALSSRHHSSEGES